VEAEGRRCGGAGNRTTVKERRKEVGNELQEVPGLLFIERRGKKNGTWPGATAAARVGGATGSGGGGRRVAAREWAGGPRDRVGEEIRRRLGVRGSKGAVLTGRSSEEQRRRRREIEKQRSRRRVEDDWTGLQFSKVLGTCL
jgi:hypothetical protein